MMGFIRKLKSFQDIFWAHIPSLLLVNLRWVARVRARVTIITPTITWDEDQLWKTSNNSVKPFSASLFGNFSIKKLHVIQKSLLKIWVWTTHSPYKLQQGRCWACPCRWWRWEGRPGCPRSLQRSALRTTLLINFQSKNLFVTRLRNFGGHCQASFLIWFLKIYLSLPHPPVLRGWIWNVQTLSNLFCWTFWHEGEAKMQKMKLQI